MTQTAIVQIGNTDNKLSQQEWNEFVREVDSLLRAYETERHFRGGSPTEARWQNYCFVSEVPEAELSDIRRELRHLCDTFRQDSIALTVGATEFVSKS